MPRILSVIPSSAIASTRSTRGGSRIRRFQTGSVAISLPTASTTSIALSMSVPNATVDVLVDPGPRPRPVRGDLDLAVRDGVDDAVEVAQRRPAQAEVLDRAGHAGDRDHVAAAELVLDEDQAAVEVVADEALGAEPDRDADDAEPRDRRADVQAERAQDHQQRDDDDEEDDDAAAELVERVHPLADLDRRQLLGRSLGRLAVDERLEDPVEREPGDPDDDDRRDDDEQDLEALRAKGLGDVAPGRLAEVHRPSLATARAVAARLSPDGRVLAVTAATLSIPVARSTSGSTSRRLRWDRGRSGTWGVLVRRRDVASDQRRVPRPATTASARRQSASAGPMQPTVTPVKSHRA